MSEIIIIKKKIGGHRLRFREKLRRMENSSGFEKLAHVTKHYLQSLVKKIIKFNKNIEDESTEANYLDHIFL